MRTIENFFAIPDFILFEIFQFCHVELPKNRYLSSRKEIQPKVDKKNSQRDGGAHITDDEGRYETVLKYR